MNASLHLPSIACVALAVSLATSPAQEQPRRPQARDGEQPREGQPREGQPRDGQRRPGGDRPAGERPEGFRGPGGPGGFGIELTEAQRDAIREASEAHREEMNQLGDRMREARRGLQEAILAEKQSEATVKSRAQEMAEVQVEQALLNAKVFAKVRGKFTPEQLERLKNAPLEMLLRGGMGPGGFGGPGGFRPGGPEGQRPDGVRGNPDNPQRRPRGDTLEGEGKARRPALDSEPK